MSFDVFFVALEPPKPTGELHALVQQAVESTGGRLLPRDVKGNFWEDIEAEGGSTFEWFGPEPRKPEETDKGGGMAVLRGFDLPICRCLYAIAVKTDWVIVGDSRSMRARESRALPLHEGMPEVLVVDDAEQLWTFLSASYGAWKEYRDQVVGVHN